MNPILEFRRKDLRQKFDEDAKHHLTFARNFLLINLFVKSIVCDIVGTVASDNFGPERLLKKLVILVAQMAFILLLTYLVRKFAKFKTLTRFRMIMNGLDLLLAGFLLLYFLVLESDDLHFDSTEQPGYLAGITITIHLLAISSIVRNWIYRATTILAVLIYFVSKELGHDLEQMILIGAIAANILLLLFGIYFHEKIFRSLFLRSSSERESIRMWRDLLNETSEGILMLNTAETCVFSSNAFNQLLTSKDFELSMLAQFDKLVFPQINEAKDEKNLLESETVKILEFLIS